MTKYFARWSVVTLALVLALGPIVPVLAQDDAGVYNDPAGLFSVPIPTNWTAQPGEGYVTLTDPDGEITVHLIVVEAATSAEGIATAWELVEPGFDLEIDQTLESPSRAGVEETVNIYYKTANPAALLVAGGGERIGSRVYVQLVQGTITAIQRRLSQIQIISTGLLIHEIERTDLSAVEPLPLEGERLAEFEAYILARMEQLQAPGVAVVIVQDGEVIYSKAFGVREIGGDPMTTDTQMMIGSTTKSMTTLMMGTLIDGGLMAWDTPVVEILPSFRVADPELTPEIIVQHLVCACTGVPRRDFELLFNSADLSAQDIVESLGTFEFFTDFGEAFQYSNQMVATGGYVATLAAGGSYDTLHQDYVSLMSERVFDPMDMNRTTFSFEDVVSGGNYAMPHGATLQGDYEMISLDVEQMLIPIAPAGAAWSTADDMAKYLIMALNEGVTSDGTRIVSAENLHHTWEPQIAISADSSYGLGWIIENYNGLTIVSHGGNTLGFSSELAFLPEAELGIVVLTNQQGSMLPTAITYRLAEMLFDQPAAVDAQIDYALEQMAKLVTDLQNDLTAYIPAEDIDPYLGRYTNEALGEIIIERHAGAPILDIGEASSHFSLYTGDDFVVATTYMLTDVPLAGLTFHFGEQDGMPVVVLGSGMTEYTFTRVD